MRRCGDSFWGFLAMLLSCVVLNALGARLERVVFDDFAYSKGFQEKKVVGYTKSKSAGIGMNDCQVK